MRDHFAVRVAAVMVLFSSVFVPSSYTPVNPVSFSESAAAAIAAVSRPETLEPLVDHP